VTATQIRRQHEALNEAFKFVHTGFGIIRYQSPQHNVRSVARRVALVGPAL
jgi:hypothetical protein